MCNCYCDIAVIPPRAMHSLIRRHRCMNDEDEDNRLSEAYNKLCYIVRLHEVNPNGAVELNATMHGNNDNR